MSDLDRRLNVLLYPDAAGGALHVAVEEFGLAFGGPMDAATFTKLCDTRSRIEKSLTDNADRPSPQEMKQYGKDIANALFDGEVLKLYNSVNGGRIQVEIIAQNTPLKQVPWEFMIWPDYKTGPHPKRSIARLVPFKGERYQPRQLSGRPLRVLLVGSDVFDMDPIPWEETKANLERIFGERLGAKSLLASVEPVFVEGATRSAFREAIAGKKFDIVHFIGHGRTDGILLRANRGQKGTIVPAEALVQMILAAAEPPTLVILSACETGKVEDIEPLGNVAEQLVSSGIPAVVANQMKISVPAIAEFSSALYRSLLADGNIDCAVNMGRIELVAAIAEVNVAAIEWGIPVLYRRPGCSELFKIEAQKG